MRYRLYDAEGNFVNAILASENFCSDYCQHNNYTYEPESEEPSSPESYVPTTEERLSALESAMLSMMGVTPSV